MIKIYQELLLKSGLQFMINQKKNYNPNNETRIKISMLRSDLCGFNDAYIVVKGNINFNKNHLLLMISKHLIIQQLMQLLLIMQIMMHLVKKS